MVLCCASLHSNNNWIFFTVSADRSIEVMKIRSDFVSKFDKLQSDLKQKEASIIQSALEKLKVLEHQLGTPSHTISESELMILVLN